MNNCIPLAAAVAGALASAGCAMVTATPVARRTPIAPASV